MDTAVKLFKNKFFLVCLCITLVLCTIGSTFSLLGFREPVREVLGVIATPFRFCATVVADAVEGFFSHFRLQGAILDENQALQDENERLKNENLRAQMIEEENARLRSYLGMKEKYPSYQFEEGMVIGASASDYKTVLTLNRGTVHGVAKDMPVMVEAGVVGCVTEVGLTWCKVSTILEKSADSKGIGVIASGSGVTGVVQGDYELSREGLCKMSYINTSEGEIQVGDILLSSGVGNVYPEGLVIGTVTEVTTDSFSREPVAIVRPNVDFSDLKYLMIVTGFEDYEAPSYQKPVTNPNYGNDAGGDSSQGGYG